VIKTAKITDGIDIDPDSELDAVCDLCHRGKSLRTVLREPQDRPECMFDEVHFNVV
jgi:hypothetical protein